MEPFVEAITDRSSLTRIQAETLELHLSMKRSEITLQNMLKKRKNVEISRGTHYRILGQAKNNVKQSLFTLALATQIGLVKPEDVQKLLLSISMMPANVDPGKVSEVLALITVLVDRIVMC